jgi:DNA replication and repair protein RecF
VTPNGLGAITGAVTRVAGCTLRAFRGYEHARVTLGSGLTVVSGPNGAGKTNLVEAIYFGTTGRSCRTANERELVRFGSRTARVVVEVVGEDGPHKLSVGFTPGEAKKMQVDGAAVERLLDVAVRPLVSVFLPDRLELVKGPPALRRAHLDQLVAALWPSRVATRRAYAQTLAQRNALIARIRAGSASRDSLASWNGQLARYGIDLMADRSDAVAMVAAAFQALAEALGLGTDCGLGYRPRSRAQEPQQLAAELSERSEVDLDRGFTSHGPHRDELTVQRAGREIRTYGSQGQQRLALLSLLLAERQAIGDRRGVMPLLLLDDVMSELDHDRRLALAGWLRSAGGQSVITTTDLEHVPGAASPDVTRIAVSDGRVLQEALAA